MPGVEDRLRAAGERPTPQRLTIAAALSRAGRRQTADELWRHLRRRDQAIGRATVFRGLEALVAAGVARRLELENHVYGYVACQPQHHHHLACTACGRVLEIDESYVRSVADRISVEVGFQVDDSRLDFYGRCDRCLGGAAEGPQGELRAAATATSRGDSPSTDSPPALPARRR